MNRIISLGRQIFRRENLQLLLVITIIASAYALSHSFRSLRKTPENTTKPVQIPVSVTEVNARAHRARITTTGRLTPRNTVTITPQVSGRIEWLNPAMYAGGHFLAGEVLFRIERADHENALARERAEVARAQTELTLEHAEANAAIAEWRALNGDAPVPELVSRAPQIAQAEAALASANARQAQARLNLSRTEYSLPFSGRVLTSSLELGEYLQAGQKYGETYNNDALEIVVSLPKADLNWLKTGDYNIEITFEEPGTGLTKNVAGTLLRSGASLDDTTRFQEIIIKPPMNINLLPGTLTQIIISSPPLPNTWKLPLSALQPGNIFWHVDADLRLRKISAGIIARQKNSIIAHAALPSARIVNSHLNSGIEGAEVRLLSTRAEIQSIPENQTHTDKIPADKRGEDHPGIDLSVNQETSRPRE